MMFLNKNKITIKIILTIIILILILTGIEHFFLDNNNIDKDYIVKVNNQKITFNQIENIFISEKERQKKILGEQFFLQNQQYINQLYQSIISQLIDEILIEQYVQKINFKVSDDQIKQAILAQEVFQVNGKFNNQKYLNLINSTGLTVNKYIDEVRKKLSVQKFLKTIANTEFTLNDESKYFFDLLSQKRLTSTMKIEYQKFIKNQKVKQEEIENYYYKNKNNFIDKEKLIIKYIKLNENDIKEDKINNNEIKNWYYQNKSKFTQPQVNYYKIIQTKTKKEATQLLNELKTGKSFKEVMNSKFIDPIVSSKNGDLGWMEASDLPVELKKANYLNNKNQFSEIIKSSTGFIILYIDDIKPSYVKTINIVKKEIIKEIQKEKKNKTYIKLYNKLNSLKNEKDFNYISGLKTYQTKWFNSDNFPEEINISEIKKIIFEKIKDFNDNKKIYSNILIDISKTCTFLIYIKHYKPEYLKKLDEVKNTIINIIKNDKSKEQAKNQAYKIISDFKSGNFTKQNLFTDKKIFSREDQDYIASEVFKLPIPEKNKISYGMINDEQGNIIILSLSRVYNTMLTNQQKKSIIFNIIQNNVNINFLSLIQDLRKNAKIHYVQNKDKILLS